MRIKVFYGIIITILMVPTSTCYSRIVASSIPPHLSSSWKIAVIGGGASGIFASIASASSHPQSSVVVLEATSKTLSKVEISGGGRCNVMHDTSKEIRELLQGYPRGRKELNGILHKAFPPQQAQQWFEARGVQLKTEADGRMFPTTDSSQTIIQTLLDAALDAGVQIYKQCRVESVSKLSNGQFQIEYKDKNNGIGARDESKGVFDAVILATGSSPVGYKLAQSLGHTIVPTVPSLFTLNTKHEIHEDQGRFHGLSGLSVPWARIKFLKMEQEGPLLITHHGLSGPAALRLSAFGAREMHECKYRGNLQIHWAPELGRTEEIADLLWQCTTIHPKRKVSTACPLVLSDGSYAIPKRLWARMVDSVEMGEKTWAEVSKKQVRKLAIQISEMEVEVTGKGTFKEEFVTAGGVSLKEINMKTMESKVCERLFLCGELIDVDGVTGGYNFMNCWGTGFVAGTNAAIASFGLENKQA